jgi:hypothetical protein
MRATLLHSVGFFQRVALLDILAGIMQRSCRFRPVGTVEGSSEGSADPEKALVWPSKRPDAGKTVTILMKKRKSLIFSDF